MDHPMLPKQLGVPGWTGTSPPHFIFFSFFFSYNFKGLLKKKYKERSAKLCSLQSGQVQQMYLEL